jgi:tetratricopeptide (TPR) repeat protein
MLRKILFALIILAGITPAKAQTVHKPSELLKIMTDSKLAYSIGEMESPIEPKDYSANVNGNYTYHEDSDGHMVVKTVSLSKEATEEFNAAEEAFAKTGNTKNARMHYQKVLEMQPDYFPAITYIAQTYEGEENYDKAVSTYKQAINKNYVDYMPHWFLADVYFKQKEYEDAADEITIASILNRNHPRIQESMKKIYEKAHLKYDDWVLTPQFEVKGGKEKEVKVLGKDEWLGYAMGKAIWKFEPGYAEGQGEKQGVPSVIEEKECMLCLFTVAENSKKKIKDKGILNLQKALENRMMDQFILYEEFFRWQPSIVYQLSNKTIKSMKDYVMLAHGGKKIKK